jgi:hypothetical protein
LVLIWILDVMRVIANNKRMMKNNMVISLMTT